MKPSPKGGVQEEKTKRGPLSKYKVIRRLGGLEGFQSALHSLGHYYSTVVTCRYAVPAILASLDLQKQLEDAFERAIAQIVLDVPALRVGLVGQDTRKPVWVEVDTVDLRRHIEWRVLEPQPAAEPDLDLDQLYRALVGPRLDTPFTQLETVPGWRVLILRVAGSRSLDVVFDWNHANMDGTSGKIFHRTLLYNLKSSISGSSDGGRGTISLNLDAPNHDTSLSQESSLHNHILTVSPTARPLAPPLEKIVQFTMTPGWALSRLWKELKPVGLTSSSSSSKKEAFSPSSPPLARWAPIRPQPYRTQARQFLLPGDQLRNVLAACHVRGATLTSLGHAIIVVSLATHLPPSAARGFISETAVDMRRFMSPQAAAIAPEPESEARPWVEDPDREVGDFVSLVLHEFGAPLVDDIRALSTASSPTLEALIWSEAVRARADIREKLDLGLKNDPVGLTKFVVDWRAVFKDRARKPRHVSWMLSNLGVLDGGEPLPNITATGGVSEEGTEADKGHDNHWSIERGMFSFGPEATGAAMRVGLLSVKGRDLCVSCCWQDSVVDIKVGEALVADLERWLGYLGRQVE